MLNKINIGGVRMKKVKKFLAGLLVSCYMLSLSVAVSAEEVTVATVPTLSVSTTTTNPLNDNTIVPLSTDDGTDDPIGW
jgi:hypothetical protein